jgi:putative SOS response-associated peptidase YedK
MRPIHHRMPVILPEADWRLWLDLPEDKLDDLAALLRPAPAELLLAHPVSPQVNRPQWDDPACLDPVADPQDGQLDLFS